MTRFALPLGVVLAVVVAAVLGACSADGSPPDNAEAPFAVDVDVDTPSLRAVKERAGVEQCEPGSTVGGELPDLELRCLGGGPSVNLSSLEGPLVINLWAQWCGPCRDELPYYQRLHEEGRGEVRVLGIDYQDTQPDGALALVRETGVTFPLLADPAGEVRVPFRVRGLPGVVFVDRSGRVAHVDYLVVESYDQLRGLVAEHLGVRL